MNIIFDLDGTLIDSRLRLYRLFQDLAPASLLSFEQYWSFKKKKISNEQILATQLNYCQSQINDFVDRWMAQIETPEYLAFDKDITGIHFSLCTLKQRANLYVCTARQFRQSTIDQLSHFNLLQLFEKVMVTENKTSKESLIAAHIHSLNLNDWLVGDTGMDVRVGKLLKIKTCAVLSGFLSRESLQPYEPDLIIDSVNKIPASLGIFA